jgi:predicted nucleic acid-binding protein
MRIVLDTNILYAALRSPQGASRVILELVVGQKLTMVLTPALFLEYEKRLIGDPALHALALTDQDLINVLDELAALSMRIRIDIRWRSVSVDPDDDEDHIPQGFDRHLLERRIAREAALHTNR